VIVASIGGVKARGGGNAAYIASKHAAVGLMRTAAVEVAPHGIRVNAVNPGTTDTPWIDSLLATTADPVAERAALEARQPHGRP
jgi:NAD(P)-dependent dehydrogenase (short-subunit alcohol dehydrogenase family)